MAALPCIASDPVWSAWADTWPFATDLGPGPRPDGVPRYGAWSFDPSTRRHVLVGASEDLEGLQREHGIAAGRLVAIGRGA